MDERYIGCWQMYSVTGSRKWTNVAVSADCPFSQYPKAIIEIEFRISRKLMLSKQVSIFPNVFLRCLVPHDLPKSICRQIDHLYRVLRVESPRTYPIRHYRKDYKAAL